jgi:uncharacterized delta-60 repeat protein
MVLALALVALLAGTTAATAHAAHGDLDTSWDADGKLALPSASTDEARAVVIQPDGKIVVGGHTDAAGDTVVWRYNPNGTPDATFNGGAPVVIPTSYNEVLTDVALAPGGKIVVAANGTLAPVIYRLNGNGSLDGSFSGDGMLTINSGFPFHFVYGVAVQPDNKIVAVGETPPSNNAAIWRIDSAGAPDLLFDNDGLAEYEAGGVEIARDVGIQPNGLIVVAGSTSVNGNGFVIVVESHDGLVHLVRTIDSSAVEELNGMAIQPDGKMALAGRTTVLDDAAFYRLNSDYSFDTSFDTDGAFGPPGAGVEILHDVAVQPDGKAIGVGETSVNNDGIVYRLNPTGGLDPSFSGDGARELDNGGTEKAYGVALASDGRIVVAGTSTAPAATGMVFRLLGADLPATAPTATAPKCKKGKKKKKKGRLGAVGAKKKKCKKKRKKRKH